MRTLLLLTVLLGSTVAHAQPGVTEPIGYYVEQPVVQLQLTTEQQDLLARGEVSVGNYVTGGILSYALGFGIGHAVQGRWSDKGWIFTVGETASIISLVYGLTLVNHHHDEAYPHENQTHDDHSRRGGTFAVAGLVGFVGLRVWQVVDAWVAPPIHNRKVRALKQRLGLTPPSYGFYLAPPQSSSASGGVAGLSVRF